MFENIYNEEKFEEAVKILAQIELQKKKKIIKKEMEEFKKELEDQNREIKENFLKELDKIFLKTKGD